MKGMLPLKWPRLVAICCAWEETSSRANCGHCWWHMKGIVPVTCKRHPCWWHVESIQWWWQRHLLLFQILTPGQQIQGKGLVGYIDPSVQLVNSECGGRWNATKYFAPNANNYPHSLHQVFRIGGNEKLRRLSGHYSTKSYCFVAFFIFELRKRIKKQRVVR